MASVGLNSLMSSVGSQYDFRKMTNNQAVSAANTLFTEGKISQTDAETLQGFAVDTVRVNGSGELQSTYSPSDLTQYNFLGLIQQNLAESQSIGLSKAATNDANLLTDLQSLQSPGS